MKIRKRYALPIFLIALVWYTFCGTLMYRDKNDVYTDYYHHHSRNLVKHLVENASDWEQAIRLLKEIETTEKNPYFEFNVHLSKANSELWCVVATPKKRYRYLGGIKGIFLGLNFRKVYYTPVVTMPSEVYNSFLDKQIESGVVLMGDNVYGSDLSGVEQADDVFGYLASIEPNKIILEPKNQIEPVVVYPLR